MNSKSNLTRRKTRGDAVLSPQVRKLDSTRSLPPTITRSKPVRNTPVSTRASAAALHLGRSACTIPEHDDLHKRNERLKEALKKEKEQTSIIRQEFEEKESEIVRENAKLRAQLEEMHDERVKTAQRHEREISLLADQHRKMEQQREISHQNEIKKIFLKNEEQIADKNKVIETLKAQIGELMKGQSAERQQQIAELRKKLVNAAQEANELRTEILKLNKSRSPSSSDSSLSERPPIKVALCMNCIVMQQALAMANAALKAKMKELDQIHQNAKSIKIGLALNDIALESLEKAQKDS